MDILDYKRSILRSANETSIELDFFYPDAFADPTQAAFFSWPGLGIFSVVGLIGVWISQYTLLRGAWERPFPIPKGVLAPLLAGVVLGVVLVVIDLLTGYTKIIVARHGLTQQYTGFLPMLLAFPGASILVEVVYRMLFLPLLLWLVSVLMLRNRYIAREIRVVTAPQAHTVGDRLPKFSQSKLSLAVYL